ncbi:hypothetical protein GCM10025331_53820 [Actinoplanes utahensis]|nr:hypothetical protein Aut01nite_61420 [Actinoplanes utahensis]
MICTEAGAGVPASLRNHSRIALCRTPEAGGDFVHSKCLLIEGKYIDDADRKWVLTGSHDYTDSALRENDEAFLRIESAAIHAQFRANFRTIRSVAGADSKSPPALDFTASASRSDTND